MSCLTDTDIPTPVPDPTSWKRLPCFCAATHCPGVKVKIALRINKEGGCGLNDMRQVLPIQMLSTLPAQCDLVT